MPDEEKYQQMLAVVKKYHGGQTREGGVKPYWPHCERTATLLRRALESSVEGSPKQQKEMLLAALGHDLYEDTAIQGREVVSDFGQQVDALIEEVTNRFGDNQVAKYAEKLTLASEEARLIKLADLADNYASGAMSFAENGFEWTSGFLWPILEAQWQKLKDLPFVKFPQTAKFLAQTVEVSREMLEAELKRYQVT